MQNHQHAKTIDKCEALMRGCEAAERGLTAGEWASEEGVSHPYVIQHYLRDNEPLWNSFRANRKNTGAYADRDSRIHRIKIICGIEYGLWSCTAGAGALNMSRAALSQWKSQQIEYGSLFALAEHMNAVEFDTFVSLFRDAASDPSTRSIFDNHHRASRLSTSPIPIVRSMLGTRQPKFDKAHDKAEARTRWFDSHYQMILCGKNISEQTYARHVNDIKVASRRGQNES